MFQICISFKFVLWICHFLSILSCISSFPVVFDVLIMYLGHESCIYMRPQAMTISIPYRKNCYLFSKISRQVRSPLTQIGLFISQAFLDVPALPIRAN
jgi:hypothetical protein